MFFELEDIKRRHSMYSDIYNVGGWVPTPDANFSWMYQRGAIIGYIFKKGLQLLSLMNLYILFK
jgi:solute carrier family 25 oxoglutarate transporter 11